MKIVWLASAERDLDALIYYISQDSPQTALQIFNAIHHSVDRLGIHPFVGRNGRVGRTRELIVPQLPYIVAYTVEQSVIILAILHTARKWPSKF